MRFSVIGAINGDFSILREPVNLDWILCTGSLGCFPDPQKADRASRKRGVGDFPESYIKQEIFNKQMIFVEGSHEDHKWLRDRALRGQFNVLPSITHLINGNVTQIGDTKNSLRILGLGKPFSPKEYNSHYSRDYYTEQEVNQCCAAGPVDILICHEGLYNHKYGKYTCQAKGIQKIIYATRPKIFIHGHYNVSKEYSFLNIPCYSLANKEIIHFEVKDQKIKRS